MGNPIIEFKQRENDELKTTGGGNNQKPQFVLTGPHYPTAPAYLWQLSIYFLG